MPKKTIHNSQLSMNNSKEPSPVRFSYLFLFAYVGLIGLAFGVAGLVNVGLEHYVLPKSQDVYLYRDAIDSEFASRIDYNQPVSQIITLDIAKDIVKKAKENIQEQKENEQQAKYSVSNRNRALSLSISFLLIGGGVYIWHRKDVFALLKK